MAVGLLIFGTSVCSNFVATQSVPKSTVVPRRVPAIPFRGIEKLKNYTATGKLVSHLKLKDGYLPRVAIIGLIIAVGLLLVAAQRYIANKRLANKRWNNDAP